MSGGPRYFENSFEQLHQADAHAELVASLQSIIENCPPESFGRESRGLFSGLYYGPTSTAFLFFRLSQTHPDLVIKGRQPREWCLAYLEPGARLHRHDLPKLDTSHCGFAQEILAHLAVTAMARQDSSPAQTLCGYASMIADPRPGGSDEHAYGRAGYLYLLRLVKSEFRDDRDLQRLLDRTIEKVVDRILQSPFPWEWHGKAYLGADHGAIGIVMQIVLSSPPRAGELKGHLQQLLDLQYPSGNFPSSLPVGSDRLVQWCHGAPGFVTSLVSLRPYFPDLQRRIDAAIEKGRRCIWERGLLTKEPCLCHGISGNALALEDRARFEHFLSFTTRKVLERQWRLSKSGDDESFHALYTGEAGRAWAWAVADKGLEKRFIGYNDV